MKQSIRSHLRSLGVKLPRNKRRELIGKFQIRNGKWIVYIENPIWKHLQRVATEIEKGSTVTILFNPNGKGLAYRINDVAILVIPCSKDVGINSLMQVWADNIKP